MDSDPMATYGLFSFIRRNQGFRTARTLPTLCFCVLITLDLWLSAPVHAESKPWPRTVLQAGIHQIFVEVAADAASRTQGLMNRPALEPNHGMLFIFQEPGRHCFWMRHTPLPLTIAFLDANGIITHLADMQPHTETSHCPPVPVQHALEMEQGWFKRRGLKPGSQLKNPTVFQAQRDIH